jgi:hypothetical protein
LGRVSGHVTKAGKPVPEITVRFDPAAGGRPSEAMTDSNGYYDLVFTADRKGALLGKHNVTVKIKEKYNDGGYQTHPAETFLTIKREVGSGSNTYDFDIAQGVREAKKQ